MKVGRIHIKTTKEVITEDIEYDIALSVYENPHDQIHRRIQEIKEHEEQQGNRVLSIQTDKYHIEQ